MQGAERTLMHFEERSGLPDIDGKPHIAKRFTREDADTKGTRARRSWRFWANEYSYYECFKAVFGAFGLVGLVGAMMSACRIWEKLSSSGPWL
jgi:hypothetical protein